MTKHFFVLLNHPLSSQKPRVMGILRNKPHIQDLYKKSQPGILSPKEVEHLGYPSAVGMRAYLLPIQIPWAWFLNEN